ncbi:MAG: Rid family detoxifying hydrolase [bacterium]|nr:RidA family protein [Gammaproteobacteria bacterium]HIL98459.1 RidA family protein [Pseudomonadales bacterium]
MRKFIATDSAPAAIGTYSQAVCHGNTLYISGQIPLNPTSMEVTADEIQGQISQVFANLAAVCNAAKTTLDNTIKFTVYLTNLGDFPIVNKTMQTLLKPPFPARAVVEVSRLPKEVLVEIDAIVDLGDQGNPAR